MYNKNEIKKLVEVIEKNNGIGDKGKLADIVQGEFALEKERKVYTGKDFAIRFSKANSKKMSNTVLSLSALQKYDDKPFFVCVVTPTVNYLLLANTTFLKKISHSSQQLRIDNIKGSFNGSDIYLEFEGMENEPKNFQELFAFHQGLTFQDNLERLVESTSEIVGRDTRFKETPDAKERILNSAKRTIEFMQSKDYEDLKMDLVKRVGRVYNEILSIAHLDNVNLRGRIMEQLITQNDSKFKEQVDKALEGKGPFPPAETEDKLGDYAKNYPNYHVEIDIKTKMLFLGGNPKGYNVDKLLEFLADEKSIYLIFIVGVHENKVITMRLASILDKRLTENTHIIRSMGRS